MGVGSCLFKSQISFQTGFSLFLFIIYPDQPLKSFWSMFSSSSHRLIMQVLVLCIKKYSLVTGSLRLISWCGTDTYLYCSVFFLFNFEVTSFRSLKTQKCLFYSYSTVRKHIKFLLWSSFFQFMMGDVHFCYASVSYRTLY